VGTFCGRDAISLAVVIPLPMAKEQGVSGERRQVENALRRRLRAQKIHVDAKGTWQTGPPPAEVTPREYSYVVKPDNPAKD